MDNKNYNFSFMFLLGFFIKKIPVPVIQFFLNYSMQKMHKKYPRIFEKFDNSTDNTFLIIPTDLPFNFKLTIDPQHPTLKLVNNNYDETVSASIKASIENLLKMFEGNLDGDAAFFSKELIIEGSTAAIVTLRNAIDSEEIDVINDLSENLSLFTPFFKNLLRFSIFTYNNIDKSLLILQQTILREFSTKVTDNTKEINKLKSEISALRSNLLYKE